MLKFRGELCETLIVPSAVPEDEPLPLESTGCPGIAVIDAAL